MRIRIIGAGWYGCHLAKVLMENGHQVEVHEINNEIFTGASGSNPARLHQGQHYPRSAATRKHCQEHNRAFLDVYGHLTRCVPVNMYAIAAHDSLVDFGTYKQILRDEIEFIDVQPVEYGLAHVEGAVLTGERHIVISDAKTHFETALNGIIKVNTDTTDIDSENWDLNIDCTFCANDSANIERYEPCITALLEGPTDKAVTIMDGPFPSLYPWNEDQGLNSLTSAKLTPLCRAETWDQANEIIESVDEGYLKDRSDAMIDQMSYYFPAIKSTYKPAGWRLGIRAQPRSGSDARLVDVVRVGKRALRVRAGKIDAVLHAEKLILAEIAAMEPKLRVVA